MHEGRHEAVIPEELYHHVQALLDHNGSPRNHSRHKSGAMLNGLLFCAHCDRAMTHSSSSNGSRRYRYYVCTQASRRGWNTCPSKSLPAGVIEQFVIDQLLAPAPGIEDIDDCESQVLTELALRWDTLNSIQRHDALHQLVRRVEYEGATGTVRLTLTLNVGDELLSEDASPATREFMIERHINFERGTRGRKQLTQKPDRNDPPPSARVPRVSRLMALAIHLDEQLRRGELRDYAQIAQLGQVSRARITQIMSLLNLAPDIQEAILYIPPVERGRDPIRELILRPIAAEPVWVRQGRMWRRLKHAVPLTGG